MAEHQLGIGQRLVALITAALALSLLVAGAAAYTWQRSTVLEQLDAELLQEVEELRQRSQQANADGRPYRDVGVLLEDFLRFNVPGEDEMMGAFVRDARSPSLVSGGDRTVDLTEPQVVAAVLAERRAGEVVLRTVETDAQNLRLAITSVQGDTDEGTLVIAIDRGSRLAGLNALMRGFAVAALLTVLLAGGLLLLAVPRMLSPLDELVTAAEEVDDRDLSRRVGVPEQETEIASLARSFNRMLKRLDTSFQAQRRFLDDTAHELRTPLTIMRGNLEVLDPADVEDVEAVRHIELVEIDRMSRIVDDLLLLARLERPDFVRTDRVDVAQLHADLLALVPALGDREWVDGGSVDGLVRLDRDRVVQAVQQLCANAVKFSEPGTPISVTTAWRGEGRRRQLTIAVQDAGSGIDKAEQERVFERFARAEQHRGVEGSGLGLPIVQAIARAHGGTVELNSEPGRGSTFTMVLPAAA